ncbi:hypothetical protein HKCCE3408_05480 [Rhodobacterales bacterium HKCCE3408]|nr:hypothetical protein [Rhodobacterales bacterium HKCCE3408]
MWEGYIRQRRRIALTMGMVMLALAFGLIGQGGLVMRLAGLFGGPTILAVIQATFALILTALSAVLFVLRHLPRQRQQCEVLAGALLIFEAINLVLNIAGAPFATPLLAVCAFILLAIAIDGLVYGTLLDFLGLWRPLASQVTFTVAATPNAAWNAIVPRPETVATHWIGALSDVSQTREPDVLVARYRLGDGTVLQKTLTILSDNHPTHMRYHFEPETDEDEGRFGSGFYEVWLDPIEDEVTEVTLACEYTALRLRVALLLWLDDWLGSEADAIEAFIERRPDTSLHGRLWRDVLRQA